MSLPKSLASETVGTYRGFWISEIQAYTLSLRKGVRPLLVR